MTSELRPGTRLGKCEVVGVLGRGGMGAVYRARHRALDIDVAVKVIAFGAGSDHERRQLSERLIREARAAARIRHDNVVQVLDVDAEGGVDYMVMELVEGESAKALLRRAPLSPAVAVRIALDAARAIAAAHRSGIIHRDIKPENILITTDGRVKVSDFGLAAWHGVDSGLTRTGQILGTPYYMAPEQVHGAGQVDQRSDIYALGATLYHLVAGRVPFSGDSAIQVCMAHLNEPVPPLRRDRPDCPLEVEQAVFRMMEKAPADRFQTCDEVIEVLRPFAAAEPPRAGVAGGADAPGGPASPADPHGTFVARGGAAGSQGASAHPSVSIGSAPSALSVASAHPDAATLSPSGAQAAAPPQADTPPPAPAPAPPPPAPRARPWGAIAVGALALVLAAWLARDAWRDRGGAVGASSGAGAGAGAGTGDLGGASGAAGAGRADGGAAGGAAGSEAARGPAGGLLPPAVLETLHGVTELAGALREPAGRAPDGASTAPGATGGTSTSSPTATPLGSASQPPALRAPTPEGLALASRLQDMMRLALEAESQQRLPDAVAIYQSIALTAKGHLDPAVQASAIAALQCGVAALERNGRYKDAHAMASQLERDYAGSPLLRMHITQEDADQRLARLAALAAEARVELEPLRYGLEWGARTVVVADLDHDRKADAVLLGSKPQIFMSQGRSLRVAAPLPGLDLAGYAEALALVDADRTGPLELLLEPERARWPDEHYALVTLPHADQRAPSLLRWVGALESRARPRERADRGAAADLDGDGLPELLLWQEAWAFVELRLGSPAFPAAKAIEVPLQGTVEALAVARGAGGPGAAGPRDAALALLEVQHKSGATTYEVVAITVAAERARVALVRKDIRGWPHLAVGDWSGDGIDDLVTNPVGPDPERRLEALLADGRGGFDAPAVRQVLEVPPAVPYAALGDLDGDGKAEVILRRDWPEEPTTLFVMRSKGDGAFQCVTQVSLTDTFAVTELRVGDIDGDGRLDVVFFSYAHSELGVLFGDGQGGFR